MSKVSDIYDAILTELDSVLPSTSYTRFPNAYDINDNPAQFLYRGYGIRYDGQARLPFEICNRRESQTFTIILTSRWDRIETRQDSIDSPAKDLLDHIGSTDIMKIDSVSTSGLESVVGENFRMLKIECTITIDYFEPVT
jgi:hypothetical protein